MDIIIRLDNISKALLLIKVLMDLLPLYIGFANVAIVACFLTLALKMISESFKRAEFWGLGIALHSIITLIRTQKRRFASLILVLDILSVAKSFCTNHVAAALFVLFNFLFDTFSNLLQFSLFSWKIFP